MQTPRSSRPAPAVPSAVPAPPVRLRHRIRPPAAGSPTAFTGAAVRTPVRSSVTVPDPVSGAGVRVAVFDHAPAAPGPAAPTIVAVHGFRGDHHGLSLLADCLPEHRVLALDLPGFGAADAYPDAEHTVAHHARTVREAVAALGVERPVLVAHSYGTVVAARAVAQAPGDWAALVLLNPIAEPALSASGAWTDRVAARAAQGYYELAARLPDRLGDALLRSRAVTWATTLMMSETADARILSHTHDQHTRHFSGFATRSSLAQAYRASTTGSVPDDADRLALPVLLVAGARDPLGSVAAQEALAARIAAVSPRVRLEVLDDVGHLLHYEKAPECAALVRGFLRG